METPPTVASCDFSVDITYLVGGGLAPVATGLQTGSTVGIFSMLSSVPELHVDRYSYEMKISEEEQPRFISKSGNKQQQITNSTSTANAIHIRLYPQA